MPPHKRNASLSDIGAAYRLSQRIARAGQIGDDAPVWDATPSGGNNAGVTAPTNRPGIGALDKLINGEGKLQDVTDFLHSEDFRNHVDAFHDPNIEGSDVDDVETAVEKWQSIGKKKLEILAEWHFKGGFLCDAAGMGKSLTALLAAIDIRKSMLLDCGFILVVCPPGRARQWEDEIKSHFYEDALPSILWLKSPNYPINLLLQHDVVGLNASGTEQTVRIFRGALELPAEPLHSTYYDLMSRNIAVLIVDEAHAAKNQNSKLSEAIRALKYHHAFLLTGTPIYNNYKDFGGMLMLLPNPPFASVKHFCDVLRVSGDLDVRGPTGTKPDILEKLVDALVLARPKTALDPEHYDLSVHLDGHWGTLLKISQLTSAGTRLLESTTTDAKMTKRGLALIVTAQKLAARPLLLEDCAISQEIDPGSGRGRHNLVADIGDSIQAAFQQWLEATSKDRALVLDELGYDAFREFEQFLGA